MTFCVSHEAPLVPEELFDLAIGIGDYRPSHGSHISAIDPFWDKARPLAYGAAGNYVIPRMIPEGPHRPELVGIYSHRKIIVRNTIGREAVKYPVYREISVSTALSLSAEERSPRDDHEFLIGAPIQFPHGVVAQYAQNATTLLTSSTICRSVCSSECCSLPRFANLASTPCLYLAGASLGSILRGGSAAHSASSRLSGESL